MKTLRLQKILILMFLVIMMVTVGSSIISAATPTELRAQIEARNAQIKKIEAEIAAISNDITATSQQRLTLENKLKQIEQERQHLLKELDLTSTKIERTDLTIGTLNTEISDKEQKISLQKKNIGTIIRRVNEYDQYSILELLVAESELSDFWQEIDNLLTLQDSSRRHVRELQGLQVTLRTSIKDKETQKQELEDLKQEIESQKKIIEQNKKEQANLVAETKNKEENYKTLLEQKQAQRDAFEAEILEYESQLKFLSNPNALPPRGSAPLSWPLENILVTSLFGPRVHPITGVPRLHNGTDFRAQTPVKLLAAADGVVMGTGDTDAACRGVSYGKWITIRHDNNLVTTSAHLSLINVKAGERVTRGQVIGYTGNTGASTAPHLHFSVYAGLDANGENPVSIEPRASLSCKGAVMTQPIAPTEAYLEPLQYLPAVGPTSFKSTSDYTNYSR
jgi:murein DD-endopeptidase MepM/ murein hydrolase activator NlpD